jgi:uncharacterized protein (TIGR03000 family)
MYTVVLMMAMTTSAEMPDFCFRRRVCHGCYGCSGCNGCFGWRRWGCHGCSGCYSWSGCYGCYGCNGCYGCYGSVSYGCHGCYVSGCYSYSYGCHACHGGQMATPAKGGGKMDKEKPDKGNGGKKVGNEGMARLRDGSALLVVSLPQDARLTVDGHATSSTGPRREFASPPLEAGTTYQYNLQATVTREGKTVSENKKILVRAGVRTEVNFSLRPAQVAKK